MSEAYRRAGVDLEAASAAVALIADLAAEASRPEVFQGVGGFAGLFGIGGGRYLAAATDGVGTKVEIARRAARLDTVGIDLVAMCVDDVVCVGAEPLFFLDYLAVGRVVPERVAAVVAGVAEGCRRAGCALLGGETAEHPGVMEPDVFDLAGFCVGVVEEDAMLGPHRVSEGDALVGLRSSGLHANGYSLVRRALLDDGGYGLDEVLPRLGAPLGEVLLEPTTIYAPLVLELARAGFVRAASHITGGGMPENLPRTLPDELGAEIREGSWPVPPIFDLVADALGVPREHLRSTFNLGVGMVLVVRPEHVREVSSTASTAGIDADEIGTVRPGHGVRYL